MTSELTDSGTPVHIDAALIEAERQVRDLLTEANKVPSDNGATDAVGAVAAASVALGATGVVNYPLAEFTLPVPSPTIPGSPSRSATAPPARAVGRRSGPGCASRTWHAV